MTDQELKDTVTATLALFKADVAAGCVPDYVLEELDKTCVSLSKVQLRRIRDQIQAER